MSDAYSEMMAAYSLNMNRLITKAIRANTKMINEQRKKNLEALKSCGLF